MPNHADALQKLSRELPGVRIEGAGSVEVACVEAAELAFLLRDGRVLVGRCVANDGESVEVRPWGLSSALTIELVDIRVVGTVSARWSAVARVGVRQRREWKL